MKRFVTLMLSLCMALSLLAPCALAVEQSAVGLTYELSAGVGADEAVKQGTVVTVTFRILRSDDSAETYKVRTLQNEILYDRNVFELVPDSIQVVKSGGNAVFQTKVNGDPVIRASYLSATGGTFQAEETFCTFQLKVIASNGTGWISCDWDKAMAFDSEGTVMTVGENANVTVAADGPCHPFTDVGRDVWYHSAVDYVFERGLMDGVGSNLFDPSGELTRAMLVTLLYRMEGCPEYTESSTFTDVKSDWWYTNAIHWAYENGLINGHTQTSFAPDDSITREQMATLLMRYAQYKQYDVSVRNDLSGYADAGDISDWALAGMQWANAAGLVNGRTATTLVPEGTANRAEIATLIMRFCEKMGQ